jgi:antirestriction protein ArdC
MKKKKNLYEEVTAKIVELLETSLIWNMPWICLDIEGNKAYNAVNKNKYCGINQLLLSFIQSQKSYDKSAWLTFNQVRTLEGNVIKGEKASPVYFFSILYYENGKRISEDSVKKMSEAEFKRRGIQKKPLLKYFSVFNVFQTNGLPAEFYEVKVPELVSTFERDERALKFIEDSGATIEHKASNEAYYNSLTDVITLPLVEQFKGADEYHSTILHELGHWTGSTERMNRPLFNSFGSKEYAKEELVAELFSAMACAELGLNANITQNSAYIKGWIKDLKDDKSLIFRASKQAEKALEFIRNEQM